VTRAALVLVLVLCAGCIVNMGTTSTVTPPEQRTPVPDKYEGKEPPELVEAGIEGCKRAAALDANLYYCAAQEQWFRWAMHRWYLAFAWDGNWFPVTGSELPPGLVKITPAPEEVAKSREERLKQLEQKLETIDGEPTQDEREQKLKELDKKLEELEKQEPAQGAH
jgi:hypothetical protein